MTGDTDWGGWRVPGAEYEQDPAKAEEEARLIANAPQLAAFASSLGWNGRANPAKRCPPIWPTWRITRRIS